MLGDKYNNGGHGIMVEVTRENIDAVLDAFGWREEAERFEKFLAQSKGNENNEPVGH